MTVLNSRIANLKKMETSDNITKELADLTLLCTEIKERSSDHKEMQKGTYKDENDFVSIFKGVLPSFIYYIVSIYTSVQVLRCMR